MPYWRLFYHIIWGTKDRAPAINERIRDDLYQVMVGKAEALKGIVYAVGGVADHVHMAVSIPPAISLAQFIGEIKGTGSHVVNHVLAPTSHFSWQTEYGVVSFSQKQLDWVIKYVLHQQQHHATGNTAGFLELSDIPYKPSNTTHTI